MTVIKKHLRAKTRSNYVYKEENINVGVVKLLFKNLYILFHGMIFKMYIMRKHRRRAEAAIQHLLAFHH